MTRSSTGRRLTLIALALACLALSPAASAQALLAKPAKPRVATGGVAHARGTSGLLEGAVNPEGSATGYYFQYGPTVAYGAVTPTTSVGSGVVVVKVGQSVTGLLPGFHYRIVATNAQGTSFGADRTFTPKALANKIDVPREPIVVVYGSSFLVTGRITGAGAAGRQVVLQSSPFPYLEPFVTVSAPAVTNALGAFSFRVTNLFRSAQLRVSTLDPRPLYSPVIKAQVAVRVTFHARPAGGGLTRLYGTVTPAVKGAIVKFQVAKRVRPGRSERETAFATQFTAKVKRATRSFSRFSVTVRLRHGGNYRALVRPPAGPYVSGSSAHLALKAAPPVKRQPRRHAARRKKKG